MKQLFLIFAVFAVSIAVELYSNKVNIKCHTNIEQITEELRFRDQQCNLTGSRDECYYNNIELAEKDLKELMEAGCLN